MEEIACVCHEVNRAYCIALGDHSQPSWDQAPAWQRESAIRGVECRVGASLSPEQSHNSWMTDKVADGWIHGPVKDIVAKTHPCILPYHLLPVSQQAKDHIFGAIVSALGELDG